MYGKYSKSLVLILNRLIYNLKQITIMIEYKLQFNVVF
jgi:hypothetical protein